MVAKHINKKNAGKPRVLAINALLHSLAALASNFSAVALALILLLPLIIPSHRQNEFCTNLKKGFEVETRHVYFIYPFPRRLKLGKGLFTRRWGTPGR